MASFIVPTRRQFLARAGALIAAPAIVPASALMPVSVEIPRLWLDGVHDDAPALTAWFRAEPVRFSPGSVTWLAPDCFMIPPERPSRLGSSVWQGGRKIAQG